MIGSFPVTGATFTYHGGTISRRRSSCPGRPSTWPPRPPVRTRSSSTGANSLTGDVPAGHTLRITDSAGGASTLTSATGFTNHGSIVLDTSVGYGDTLAITAGALTNAADGSVSINYGVGGPATISGQVVNDGTVTIGSGATLSLAGGAPDLRPARRHAGP